MHANSTAVDHNFDHEFGQYMIVYNIIISSLKYCAYITQLLCDGVHIKGITEFLN